MDTQREAEHPGIGLVDRHSQGSGLETLDLPARPGPPGTEPVVQP